ncbi:cytochrome c biogenesis protein ResB [Egibacter rhizosphaerae]|uniref:Cytochrome c biogenesis protein ResB n=1 Tax=Egibacter rhizosphaerae TaxID=1670831 RepID=A0A411YGL3_9ACTN|nr:cytochrome c biogenesis protein ResB [Egibacter rhizosphaerae]QBI20343.1 cytochrome c biogenesis protein ResB [Egibacter rhizosphaerae]
MTAPSRSGQAGEAPAPGQEDQAGQQARARGERAAGGRKGAPGGVLGPGETVVWLWRRLRRMSTALWLLFALAAASLIATFVPQEPVIPTTVADWREGVEGPGPEVAAAFDALGLFDVYGSWWFIAVVVLLFVSLTGCLIPRWKAFAVQVRRPPVAGRNLDRLSHRREIATDRSPEEALTAAERVLRRHRFRRRRVAPDEASVAGSGTGSARSRIAAERGHWREGGSLLFHTSFYVLLAGVIGGHALGFFGQVNVVEGDAFTDTRIAYDRAEPGALFGADSHRGFTVRLDEFDVRFAPNQVPSEFVSSVTVLEEGEEVHEDEVRVNDRLEYAGMNLYQMRWGYAPELRVRSGDEPLYEDHLMLREEDTGAWTGVAKVAVGDPQIALEVLLIPDFGVTDDGEVVNRGPEAENPRLFGNLWVGDLGFERALPAAEFDREGGERLATVELEPGSTQQLLGDDLVLDFDGVAHWSGFQVAHQPGRGVLLFAAALLLAGLVPSLYAYRRRLWVDVHPSGQGSAVRVAGVAQQRGERFADEFERVGRELEDALAGEPRASSDARMGPAGEDSSEPRPWGDESIGPDESSEEADARR